MSATPTTGVGGFGTTVNPSNEWKYLFTIDNPSPVAVEQTVDKTQTASVTATAKFEGGVTLTLDDILELSSKLSIESSQTFTSELKVGTKFTADPYSKVDCYYAPSSQLEGGMCSAWGTAGYVSDGSWSGTYVPVPNTPSPGQVITKKCPGYQEKVP